MSPRINQLTAETRKVLEVAREESRRLGHGFIGTEHLLLGLLQDSSIIAVFKALGLNAAAIQREVEKLAPMGLEADFKGTPPQTPRAAAAIDHAGAEITILLQGSIGPEHLLVGLLVEGGGVAALVLRKFGLTPDAVRPCAYRIRWMQIKTVERIVRPVRATTPAKRRMREELLAHLEAICEDEKIRANDPDAAIAQAARRLGDPAELTRQLESSLPAVERFKHVLERHFGWRAPESAARYLSRASLQIFAAMAICACLWTSVMVTRLGWNAADWIAIRPFIALMIFIPLLQFFIGLLYFKMRDTIWGVFGARRPAFHVLLLGLCMALLVLVCDFAFMWLLAWDYERAMQLRYSCVAAAFAAPLVSLAVARFCGPTQIIDTLWACVDVA